MLPVLVVREGARETGDGKVISKCRACDAPMIWTVNQKTGNRMPIDAEAVPDGNVEVVDWDQETPVSKVLTKRELGAHSLYGMPVRYTSHHATCPKAEAFRHA